MANIKLKRYTGSAWEQLNPETTWSQIQSKPSTFTPTSHTHTLSQITDAGTVAAIDTNGSTTQFLRGDGSFATPDIDGGNAQTLDNLDSTAFLRSNANDDFSGTLNYTPDTGTILSVDGQAILQRMTANGAITIGHDDAVIIAGGDTSGTLNSNINNATETVFVGAEGGFVAYAFPSNNTAWSNRKEMNWNGTNLTLLGNNVLTTADEGSGNGLDADTLDGSHASDFYLASNPNGYTSNTGDITSVTAGTGLSGGGSSGAVTLNLDLSEFTDMTTDVDGLADELILLDSGAERRKAIAEIKLSQFNNDAGWTSNSGDITGVTAGDGLTGGGSSGSVTISHADTSSQASVNNSGRTYIQDITLDTYGHITGITSATETVTDTNTTYSAGTGIALSGTTFNLDFSELSDITLPVTDSSEMIVQVGSTEGRKALGEIDISVFNNDAGFTTNTGDITSVTAGSGLSGGGTSGGVTLSHADTSSQASVNNSGSTFIQDITLDTYGHITGITSAAASGGGGVTSIKNFSGPYVNTNGFTAKQLPLSKTLSTGDRIGLSVIVGTTSSYGTRTQQTVWLEVGTSSHAVLFAYYDNSTSTMRLYSAEVYISSGNLYIDDAVAWTDGAFGHSGSSTSAIYVMDVLEYA